MRASNRPIVILDRSVQPKPARLLGEREILSAGGWFDRLKARDECAGCAIKSSRNLFSEVKLVCKVLSRRSWIKILLALGCLGILVWFVSNRGEVTVTITGIDHSSKPPRLMIVVHNGKRRPVTLGYVSGYVMGRPAFAELSPPIPGKWGLEIAPHAEYRGVAYDPQGTLERVEVVVRDASLKQLRRGNWWYWNAHSAIRGWLQNQPSLTFRNQEVFFPKIPGEVVQEIAEEQR